MKVLLIGGGGREHALGWKIAQSPRLTDLYLAPGNPGLNRLGTPAVVDGAPIAATDVESVVTFARATAVDLVVVGPEAPLAAGLADALETAGIACFGASRAAAALETSKAFAKDVCNAVGAPTARHARFDDLEAARAHLDETPGPYVVKADGLAAGKGVVVAETRAEAHGAAEAMLGGEFGPAGAEILIEEFLPGVEASFFALCDGVRALPLIAAQDHKRAFDGDKGPNTGGMGAYAPAPAFTDAVRTRTIETIVEPVLGEMARRGAPYRGVLYVGLMIDDDQPRVVEFNARFGDPECQILMRLLKSDVLPLLDAAARGDLSAADAAWSDEAAALVVLAAEGYPGPYEKGAPIRGLEAAEAQTGVVVFHAGTRAAPDGGVVANGGRVLNVSAVGRDVDEAVARAYAGVDAIDWPGGFFRTDIGRPRAGGGR